jgi:hypothetical protein
MDKVIIDNLGNSNILITTPHGGSKKPKSIPNRTYGKLYRDSYTKSLTKMIVDRFNVKPSYLICNLHRSKLDLNRDLKEATQGNIQTTVTWYYWNYMASLYKSIILSRFHKGLYIDIHSHNTSDKFQLGYNISTANYGRLFNRMITTKSTLDSLNNNQYEMLFGENSIKNSLEKSGFKVFHPRKGRKYFNGGYNIETFSGDGLGGIQIEVPISVLRRQKYRIASALYKAIKTFNIVFCE